MENIYVVGLMSGTSLDGVDIVYTEWNNDQFKILKSETVEYDKYWLSQLNHIAKHLRGSVELDRLNVELGCFFGELVLSFLKKNQITNVDLIASHGHTVHHQPEIGYTLQIGSGNAIFKKTNIKTVCDFREQDVLFGGQGAPLVPIGDQLLFSQYDYCLNLGGFSNVSYDENGIRRAFDICPVNTVLNFYANKLGFDYDNNGELSEKGIVNQQLLKDLNNLSFYNAVTPKSLGVEFLTNEIYPIMSESGIGVFDLMRTFVEHISRQITNKLKKGTVLVTGGGANHVFLIDRIKTMNPNLKIIVPDNELVNYKEALIFALLGKLKIENKINCLKSVTGASKNHSSGVVFNS